MTKESAAPAPNALGVTAPKTDLGKRETRAMEQYRARLDARPPAPALKYDETSSSKKALIIDHPDQALGYRLLSNALGCSSTDALQGLLGQLTFFFTRDDELDLNLVNFGVKAIAAMEPRNELEGMLAVQMVAVHSAAIKQLRSMQRANTLQHMDAYERAATKLMRTFAAQMETLRKQRSGGRQHVEVRHVHVNEGGQAIIGPVDARRGADKEDPKA